MEIQYFFRKNGLVPQNKAETPDAEYSCRSVWNSDWDTFTWGDDQAPETDYGAEIMAETRRMLE